jgi:RNA polymerase sigma-70 factor (ECF subfamily)
MEMTESAETKGSVRLAEQPFAALTFETFFETEHLRLGRAIFLLTGDAAEAEDLVQEAFARAYERWERVAAMDHPAGYVYRTAANLHRRRLRRRRLLRPLGDASALAAVDHDAAAFADVMNALARLTIQQREVVVLVDLLGFDANGAADVLSVRVGTVRVRLHRGRARLRELLGGNDD